MPLNHLFARYSLVALLSFQFFRLTAAAQQLKETNKYTYQYLGEYANFLNEAANAKATDLDKALRKNYSQTISDKNKDILSRLKGEQFLFDATLYPYLKAVFDNIIVKNKLDKTRFHFFVDRTTAVNAYSYEEGTVVCNLGLIGIAENESQIAMVLCHEIGHYLLNHVNNAIVAQLEKYRSPEFLAKVKTIRKQEYNSRRQLDDLLTADVFDRRKHSRSQEKAADSLAVLLYQNTAYGTASVPRIFDLLDAADQGVAASSVKTFFNNEGIKVEESAIQPSRGISFGAPAKKEIIDSLKTHPDCAQRKEIMTAFFIKAPKSGPDYFIGTAGSFKGVKDAAFFDMALHLKDNNHLSRYLYQLIQNNARYPSSANIKAEIYGTLQLLTKYSREHKLHTVIDAPYHTGNENDEYAKLLNLLDGLSLSELTEITNNYYYTHKSQITASN